jgi:hypothetical protein
MTHQEKLAAMRARYRANPWPKREAEREYRRRLRQSEQYPQDPPIRAVDSSTYADDLEMRHG